MRDPRFLSFVSIVGVAVGVAVAAAIRIEDNPEAIVTLAIAVLALVVSMASVVANPDWEALQDELKAIRRATEAQHRVMTSAQQRRGSNSRRRHPLWLVLVVALAALVLRRSRR